MAWIVSKTKTGLVRFKIKEFKTKKEAKQFIGSHNGRIGDYCLVIDKK